MDPRENPFAVVAKHQKTPPVEAGDIAREFGVALYRVPLGQGIAGMLKRDPAVGGPSGFAIYVNSDDHILRQRFTVAHELAHYILHRDLIKSVVTDDTMYRSALPSGYETQANQLAADILMPVRLVRSYWEKGLSQEKIAALFNVSEQVMAIRLSGMSLSRERQAS
jgi:IrrE N-terminal-like domain